MAFIEAELAEVRDKLTTQVEGTRIIQCHPALVAVEITKTKYKQLIARFQFPEGYPDAPILIELQSKTLSLKLCDGLCKVCEAEAKKILGKKQVAHTVSFLRTFLDENPFSVCSDELSFIKKNLATPGDEVKTKQKSGVIVLKINQGAYFMHVQLTIPNEYPTNQVEIENKACNFPALFIMTFMGQATEMARQCTEPPLRKKPKDPPFEPAPSLKMVAEHFFKSVRRYPQESCPLCKERVLPEDPKNVITVDTNMKYVERVYCGHAYHHGCLNKYLKTPPFEGGKKCPDCGNRIYHDKWKVTPELAEARWAHKEAKRRELDEVMDFLE
ncbi:hypothetical protein Bbelb_167830 [Branchiostoma belcheri]|nr:hypothetical protein Bbelb_167830 [Branchiostoma belcheri]